MSVWSLPPPAHGRICVPQSFTCSSGKNFAADRFFCGSSTKAESEEALGRAVF